MTYHERNTLSRLISTLVVVPGFLFYLFSLAPLEGASEAEALAILGRAFLVMVGAGVVVTILATILVNIGAGIVQGVQTGESPKFITDERDHLIEQRGMRWGTDFLGVGMVGSMALLAFGQPAFVVFVCLILAAALSDVLASVLSLYWQRRGF